MDHEELKLHVANMLLLCLVFLLLIYLKTHGYLEPVPPDSVVVPLIPWG